MCLAVSGRLVSVQDGEGRMDCGGVTKSVELTLVPDARVGDTVETTFADAATAEKARFAIQDTMPDMQVVQTESKNKNAIGYVGLGYVDKSTKPLKVNNVTADAETAVSKQWPIARELYIFTNGAPKGVVKEFVDYLLAPDKGQKDVLEVGYVPLSK